MKSSSYPFANRKSCLWSQLGPFSRFPTFPFSLDLTKCYSPYFPTFFPSPRPTPCLRMKCLSSPPPYRSPARCSAPCSSEGLALPFCIWVGWCVAKGSKARQHCEMHSLPGRWGRGGVRCLEFLIAGNTIINSPPPWVAPHPHGLTVG